MVIGHIDLFHQFPIATGQNNISQTQSKDNIRDLSTRTISVTFGKSKPNGDMVPNA